MESQPNGAFCRQRSRVANPSFSRVSSYNCSDSRRSNSGGVSRSRGHPRVWVLVLASAFCLVGVVPCAGAGWAPKPVSNLQAGCSHLLVNVDLSVSKAQPYSWRTCRILERERRRPDRRRCAPVEGARRRCQGVGDPHILVQSIQNTHKPVRNQDHDHVLVYDLHRDLDNDHDHHHNNNRDQRYARKKAHCDLKNGTPRERFSNHVRISPIAQLGN